jgi:hypothetical protein
MSLKQLWADLQRQRRGAAQPRVKVHAAAGAETLGRHRKEKKPCKGDAGCTALAGLILLRI